jgi:N-acetylneuraminic acid mutarotase
MLRKQLRHFTLSLMLLWPASASAHFPWLVTEPAGIPTRVKVYFSEAAEPDDPELLDRLVKADVWVLGGRRGEPQPLSLKKMDDALEADLPAEAQASAIILRHTYGVVSEGGEPFLLKYYAKTFPSPLPGTWRSIRDSERLALEVTPKLDGSATRFCVTWQGEPVAGVTVTVTGPGIPNKWEGPTDDEGTYRCHFPQAGRFSIRARHVENTAGELDGMAFKSIRHYSTLSLNHRPARCATAAHKFPELPQGITSFGGAIVGDVLFIFGGNYGSAHDYSMDDQSGDLWKLNLKNPSNWEQISGPTKLQGLAMVEHGGSLYRIGGFSAMNKAGEPQDLRSQADFARFNTQEKSWEALPNLPEPRSSHDAAVVGDTLFVVGGWNLRGKGSTPSWHDTAHATSLRDKLLVWKTIATPPFKRRALALAGFRGRLYCIGGMQEKGGPTNAVAIYDPTTNEWLNGPNLIGGGMEGFGASAFACRGALYITTQSGSIQRLVSGGTEWEYLGQLDHARFFHRLLPWQNEKLIAVGGGSMTSGKVLELELLSSLDAKPKSSEPPRD